MPVIDLLRQVKEHCFLYIYGLQIFEYRKTKHENGSTLIHKTKKIKILQIC